SQALGKVLADVIARASGGIPLDQKGLDAVTGPLKDAGYAGTLSQQVDLTGPASWDLRQDPAEAVPLLELTEVSGDQAPAPEEQPGCPLAQGPGPEKPPKPHEKRWSSRRDLLASGPTDRHF